MMVNFEIEENYALIYKGLHIDLHNNFDFTDYVYQVAAQQLELTWKKSSGNWVNIKDAEKIILLHLNVSFINFEYDNKGNNYSQDNQCLSEISFFPSSDRKTNNQLSLQRKPQLEDDIIYTFEAGYFIRVGCREIKLAIE